MQNLPRVARPRKAELTALLELSVVSLANYETGRPKPSRQQGKGRGFAVAEPAHRSQPVGVPWGCPPHRRCHVMAARSRPPTHGHLASCPPRS